MLRIVGKELRATWCCLLPEVRHGVTYSSGDWLVVRRPSVKFSSVRRMALFGRMERRGRERFTRSPAFGGAGWGGFSEVSAGSGCEFADQRPIVCSHFGKILRSGVRATLFREFSTGFSGFSRGLPGFPGREDHRIRRSAVDSPPRTGGKDWFSTKVFLSLWKTRSPRREFSAGCGKGC